MSESFEVKTGVRQGCLLSTFLFFLAMDWIMRTNTTVRNNGIQWTLQTQLDDLHFDNALALLSHNHSQMLDKTNRLATTLTISRNGSQDKPEESGIDEDQHHCPITNHSCGGPIREVESVYLESVVDRKDDADRDVKSRIGKEAFTMVKRRSRHQRTPTRPPNCGSSTPMF